MKIILSRMAEPSTWAGIAAILVAFGLSQPEAKAITDFGVGFASLAAIFLPERGA
ncbi:MAG: hypothetical protein H7829_17140 [Magnetococcus sp. THC-1_WYH]